MPRGERREGAALLPHVLPHPFPAGSGSSRFTRPAQESELDDRLVRHPRDRLPVHLQPPVEPPHHLHVEAAAELGQGRDGVGPLLRQPPADQRGRLVGWEEPPVVPEHHEVVARDEPVGRVPIDHIHLPRSERLVFHRRQERAHLGEAEPVGAPEPRQPVGPADEVGGEAGAEPGTDPCQVAQCPETEAVGGGAPDGDGVGVFETQRRKPAHSPAPAELPAHPTVDLRRVGGGPLAQNREEPGAGVLRIDVGGAAAERAERDLGGAEAEPALDPDSARFQQLREHLGEHVRLAERLGADHHRRPLRRLHRARAEKQGQQQNAHAIRARRSSSAT